MKPSMPGAWAERGQAFVLVAGRCSVAAADILFEIREKKRFRPIEPTWERFCAKRLGLTRSYVDRVIRHPGNWDCATPLGAPGWLQVDDSAL